MWRLVTILLVACSSSPAPSSTAARPATRAAVSATATHEVTSEDVLFDDVPGTLTAPKAAGSWPAVVLLAGSGPTDRDWNSPLLSGTNGSAALLATALSKHGAVVLRFDKAGTGKNTAPVLSLDTYRDEAAAALAFVRARPNVDRTRVYIAGHSEGGLHATRVAEAESVAGVIYLASASRPLVDAMLAQIENQLKNPAAMLSERAIETEMTSLRAAFADFLAARPVDPQKASKIPQLQTMVTHLIKPGTASLTRALLGFDTAAEAAKLPGPFLVVSGGKDLQMDPDLDGRRLEKSLRDAGKDVTFVLAPDADHVLKHEPQTLAELRSNVMAAQTSYNAAGREIDDTVVRAIVTWLSAR